MKYLILLSLILCVGCSTGYHEMDHSGGYYHEKLNENTYIVGFNGNGFTNYKTAKEYSIRRALEIGDKLNFKYMVIDGEQNRSIGKVYSGGSNTYTQGNISNNSFSGTSHTQNNNMHVTKPRAVFKIVYFEEVKGRHLKVYNIDEELLKYK